MHLADTFIQRDLVLKTDTRFPIPLSEQFSTHFNCCYLKYFSNKENNETFMYYINHYVSQTLPFQVIYNKMQTELCLYFSFSCFEIK